VQLADAVLELTFQWMACSSLIETPLLHVKLGSGHAMQELQGCRVACRCGTSLRPTTSAANTSLPVSSVAGVVFRPA
jgi:hypothetical protein